MTSAPPISPIAPASRSSRNGLAEPVTTAQPQPAHHLAKVPPKTHQGRTRDAPKARAQSQIPQSLEQSTRKPATHNPKTSTYWNNHPADRTPIVPILPVTGGNHPARRSTGDQKPPSTGEIHPRKTLIKSQIPHLLEESTRQTRRQSPYSSTHWNNHPADEPFTVLKPPSTGTIRTLSSISILKIPRNRRKQSKFT